MDPITWAQLLGGIGGTVGGFASLAMFTAGWIKNSRDERLKAAQKATDDAARRAADEERERFQKRLLRATKDKRVDPDEAARLLGNGDGDDE